MTERIQPRILYVSTSRFCRSNEEQISCLLDTLKTVGWSFLALFPSRSLLRQFCRKHCIESVSYKRKGYRNFLPAWKIYRLNKKKSFDLIYVYDSQALYAIVPARFLGLSLSMVFSRFNFFSKKPGYFKRRMYNHPAIKAIVCVSKAVKNNLESIVHKKELLRIIPAGIDLATFKVEIPHGRLRREYFIPDDFSLVGNVAPLVPQKDYLTFLKAAKILLKSNPRVFSLAIGKGPQRDELEKAIEKVELKDHFRITGKRKEIPEVLAQLDVLMLSSVAEGIGLGVLNAFAAGTSVAATAAGSIPEMVVNEYSGLISPVGDAKQLAANDCKILEKKACRKDWLLVAKKAGRI